MSVSNVALTYDLNAESGKFAELTATSVVETVGSVIVTVKLFVPVNAPNVAPTVNVYVPAVVGVPVIVPEVFSVRPGGRVPDDTDHDAGSSAPVSSALRVSE